MGTRRAKRWGRDFVAFLLAALLLWCSSGRIQAVTPEGVQCPTAAIQTIAVPVRNCCGHVVATVLRKPRPGEKGFLQCRCAEKRSGQQQANADAGPRPAEMLPPSPFALVLPVRPAQPPAEDTTRAALASVPSHPFVPPPSLV